MNRRFNDVPGFEPSSAAFPLPTAEQIAALGDALPPGEHVLTDDQQRVWFGRVVFDAPVRWDGDAFVSANHRVTPAEVAGGQ